MALDIEALVVSSRWRIGRSLGRSVYAEVDSNPDQHVFVGMMETRLIAEQVVADHNAVLQRLHPAAPEWAPTVDPPDYRMEPGRTSEY
jgi:hypothetical protein